MKMDDTFIIILHVLYIEIVRLSLSSRFNPCIFDNNAILQNLTKHANRHGIHEETKREYKKFFIFFSSWNLSISFLWNGKLCWQVFCFRSQGLKFFVIHATTNIKEEMRSYCKGIIFMSNGIFMLNGNSVFIIDN